MGRSWDAVIDMFAARNIPIRTIERASGIIATEQLAVGDEGKDWADCGEDNGTVLAPNFATYNVLVRGDSVSSLIKATVRWTREIRPSSSIECSTRHVWERELELQAKGRAEAYALSGRDSSPEQMAAVEPALASSAGAMPPTAATDTPAEGSTAAANHGLRSGVELLREPTFSAAVSDLQSLNALQGFGETGRDTLTVQLTSQGIRSLAIRHYLRRLFYAYRFANDLRPDTLLLLTHGGRVVGTYSETGLDKRDWR
jgi:hypothetical protein